MASASSESNTLTFKEFLEKVSSDPPSTSPAPAPDPSEQEEPPVQRRVMRIDPYDESVPLRPAEVAPYLRAEAMDFIDKLGCPASYVPCLVHTLCSEILAADSLDACKIERPKGLPDKINYDRYHTPKIHELFTTRLRELSASWISEKSQPPRPLESSGLSVSVCSDRGKRRSMEDRHFVCLNTDSLVGRQCEEDKVGTLCGVFDGHGGFHTAEYVYHQLFHKLLTHSQLETDAKQAIRDSILSTDAAFSELAQLESWKCGTTVLLVYMRGLDKLHVGWAGDSQAFLYRQGKVVKIMTPHKPEDESEKERIEKAGGFVAYLGAWRVNGVLSVARAIGDIQQKPSITADPDVSTLDLTGEEDYLVMGCDGLWDAISPEKIPDFVEEHFKKGGTHDTTSEFLVGRALKLGSMDNVTVIVLFFPAYHPPKREPIQPQKSMTLADYFN